MPSYVRAAYDVTIATASATRAYRLARQGPNGARAWQRSKPAKAEFRKNLGDVQPGQREGEFTIIFDNTPAAGWGEQRRRPGGEGKYAYARNCDARVPGQVTLGPLLNVIDCTDVRTGTTNPTAAPTSFYEFTAGNSGKVYFAWGQYVIGITTNGMTVDQQEDLSQAADLNLANAAISQVAVFDTYAHLAVYNTSTGAAHTLVRQTADGDANFAAAGAGAEYDALSLSADTTGAVLYGVKREGTPSITQIDKLASGSAATTAGNWTDNQIQVGDTGEICRWLVPFGYQVFAAQPNGFYGFDEAYNSPNVIAEMRNHRATANGLQTWQWHGTLWVPTSRGLYGYDGGTGLAGPEVGATVLKEQTDSRHFGYPTAGCGEGEWQYAAYWNGTDQYIFAGHEDDNSPTGLVWHPIVFLDATTYSGQTAVTCMSVTGQADPPNLLMGRKAPNASAIVRFNISRADNPLQDTSYSYQAAGTFYTSEHDAGIPGVSMTLEDMTIEFTNVDADETLIVYYSCDHGTTWTQMRNSAGTAVTLNNTTTSPYVGYPVNDSTRVGETVWFYVDFARGSTTTNTPVLKSIKARVIKRYGRDEMITCSLRCADGILDHYGITCPDSGQTLYEHLTGLEDDTTPFTVTDPLGNSLRCLLEGDVKMQEERQEDEAYPELVATCAFRVLTA